MLWPLADHLGTIRDIGDLDESANAFGIANHRVYDSFGNLISQTNSSASIEFGYTGKYFDPDTGLSYHWNRWFDPALGKWLTPDPLGLSAGDANLYRYVGNQSTGAIDPTGLVEETGGNDGVAAVDPGQGVATVEMAVPESTKNVPRIQIFSPRHSGYTITRNVDESFTTRTLRRVHNGFLGTFSTIGTNIANATVKPANGIRSLNPATFGELPVEPFSNPITPMYDPEGDFSQGQTVGNGTTQTMAAVMIVHGIYSLANGLTALEGALSSSAAETEGIVLSGGTGGTLTIAGSSAAANTKAIATAGVYIAQGGLTIGSGGLILSQSSEPGGISGGGGPRNVASGKNGFRRAVDELGINKNTAGRNLHKIKKQAGRGGANNVDFDLDTGDVIAPETGEIIGNLFDG